MKLSAINISFGASRASHRWKEGLFFVGGAARADLEALAALLLANLTYALARRARGAALIFPDGDPIHLLSRHPPPSFPQRMQP